MDSTMTQAGSVPATLELSPDDNEAARLIREHDWAATPLGDPSGWSPSLRMMVRFLLANRFPLLLWWGPDYIQLYNDAYAPILGTKHPERSLGKPFRECWSEVYHILGPLVDTPFNGGPSTWIEDLELIIRRHGFAEESHFTVAYSPVPDETAPRGIGGVLATVHEITDKVIGERRVQILSELGARVAEAKTDVAACQQAVDILARHPKDVPFALLYLLDDATRELRLVSMTGIEAGSTGPARIDVDAPPEDLPWPLVEALSTEARQSCAGPSSWLRTAAPGPWPDPPNRAVVIPIRGSVPHRPAGALVVGISACIRLDDLYTSFLELVGSQIATAVANARAYEEERRRAEALAEIDRAKTAFFSNVSHEFRTPLTLLLGPIDDALATRELPEAVRGQLQMAQRNALRLQKLVNSLLDFARIEAGRIEASFAPVDLAALTADLSSTFRSAMQRAGLAFHVECECLDEPTYVDWAMWEKIVLNLLSNAFKFTFEGTVSVRLTREERHAVLEVTDTGVGVAPDEIPRLFDRFHRVEGTPSRTHEGSGIGLALVQELVRLHGGRIDVESVLGRGTTFRVRIPMGTAHLRDDQLAAPSVRPSTPIAAQSFVEEALRWLPDPEEPAVIAPADAFPGRSEERFASTFGSRILLADDNADMRAYVRELLGPFYRVETVADGAQALDAARLARPDLIVSDVMMPQVGGFELIDALRGSPDLRDVPVILLSARAGEESRIEGLRAGADDYVVKPFHARELLARVGALLELTRVRRDSDERFRAYVQATSDIVYRMSPDWTEMRFLEGRNFVPDQLDASTTWLQKYVLAEDQPGVVGRIQEAIRTKRTFEIEHRVIRADGTPGWVFSRAIPLLDGDGEIVEWFGAASDITERHETQEALRRQQRELEEADRQKNEFLAMLAHELRNPLAPIRNASEILTRTFGSDTRARSALATVERQVTHLTRLVDDLLDISRITQGRIELRRSLVHLEDVVARAVETVDPLVRQGRHKIAVVRDREPLIVNADPERLVQCLGNVLANAAKYTPPDGELRVECRRESDAASVTISDNGVGIASELLPKVFDLFVQGDRSLDRAQGGLGVGLTIVKRLIEMHGGTIGVRSAGVGQGASFEIRLPLSNAEPDSTERAAAAGPAARRILVVDDNRDGAETMADLLRLDGHVVETAFSGLEALKRVGLFHPDVALLDIGLPVIDGYEVARRIRADPTTRDIELVAITGYGQGADRERALNAGFAAHLVKPVDFHALQAVLARLPATPAAGG